MINHHFHFDVLHTKNKVVLFFEQGDEETWTQSLRDYVLNNAKCLPCGEAIDNDFYPCGCKHFSGEYYLCSEAEWDKSLTDRKSGSVYDLMRKANRIIHQRNSSERRRARLKQIEGEYTERDIHRLRKIHDGCCYYCGISHAKLQIEHLVPVAKKGTNHFLNLVLACPDCNASKHSKTNAEFWAVLKKKHPPAWIKERRNQAKRIDASKELFRRLDLRTTS